MSGLFTVLIAEKEHIDAIRQENKLFFEPFLENNELAFCYWNPEGQNLNDSVPGLQDAVGRRGNWRAVIVNNCPLESLKARNPFDITDNGTLNSLTVPDFKPAENESLASWEARWRAYYDDLSDAKSVVYKSALEYPLQKLSTWLCFRPENYVLNEVQEKKDVRDWVMERVGNDTIKPSSRLEFLEREQYKREMRLKEGIRRDFAGANALNISYPSEIYCISPRTAENSFFDPDAYWNIRSDLEYSAFADRNMYFDKMRFLVFDLLPRTHRNFRTDYIRFLASVLVFAINQIPVGAMQPRRLYQIETDADETPLRTIVTSYDRKLMSTFLSIENEMERIRSEIPSELTDKDAEALFCTARDVPVQLDESCSPEKVIVDQEYGLFFDQPENEHHKWNRSYRVSSEALAYISRQRIRSVRKGVMQMHLSSEVSDANISRLTPLQIDDIRDYTDTAEDEMVASIPPDLKDISSYTERMKSASDAVKKTVRCRMTKKTTLILGGICLGLYLICFLPFLFTNIGSVRAITTSAVLSAGMLGLLACIMLITLFFLRSSVLKDVKAYNETAQNVMNEIQISMKRVSKYLSAFCNVRRGHAVQDHAYRNIDEYTKGLRIRKKHQEDIRRRRAYLAEEYQDYFGDRSCCDETMSRPYDYDFDQKTEYAYPAPYFAGDSRQIEFISNGNFVTVPSSYITRILLRMEGIYE